MFSATPMKSSPDSGSRLYSFHLLVGLIGQLLCPNCKSGPLLLHEKPLGIGGIGFHSELHVKCKRCGIYVANTKTSETLQNRTSVTNVRAVASARNAGIGYSQLVKRDECTSANASTYLSETSYAGMLK